MWSKDSARRKRKKCVYLVVSAIWHVACFSAEVASAWISLIIRWKLQKFFPSNNNHMFPFESPEHNKIKSSANFYWCCQFAFLKYFNIAYFSKILFDSLGFRKGTVWLTFIYSKSCTCAFTEAPMAKTGTSIHSHKTQQLTGYMTISPVQLVWN